MAQDTTLYLYCTCTSHASNFDKFCNTPHAGNVNFLCAPPEKFVPLFSFTL